MSFRSNALAVSAFAVFSLLSSAPALAAPASTEAAQIVRDDRAHDVMVAMMDMFVGAFDTASVGSDALQKQLLARVEAAITELDQKN